MQQLAHGVHLAEQQRLLHLQRLGLQPVERFDHRRLALTVGLGLALDDARRLSRLAHVAQQQPVLELVQHIGPDDQRIHHRDVAVELDEVEPAEGGGVLVLPPTREPHVHALDAVGELRGLVARERAPQPLAQDPDQRHHHRARGAEPRARRRVAVHPQIEAAAHLERAHHRLDQVQVAVEAEPARMVVLGDDVVVEAQEREPRVAPRAQRGVGVLVDGRGEHHPAVLFRVGRDVGAAAAERQAQRRARAEVRRRLHALNARSARSHSSGVPMSKNSPAHRKPCSRPSAASPGRWSCSSELGPAGRRRHSPGANA